MSKAKFVTRARQFVAAFPVVGEVIADKAINWQDTKVDAALDDLKAQRKRLADAKVDTHTLDLDYTNLMERRKRALEITDKARQYDVMLSIKNAAVESAAEAPLLVAAKLANEEIQKNLALLSAAYSRVEAADIRNEKSADLKARLNALRQEYADAQMKSYGPIREQAFALTQVKASVRKELQPFQDDAKRLLTESVNLVQLRAEVRGAIDRAAAAVQTLPEGPVRQGLDERLKTLVALDLSNADVRRLSDAAAEAERLCTLCKRGLPGAVSNSEDIAAKVRDALAKAESDPTSSEGQMMSALGGREKFEAMAIKAYEQVAISGCDIRPLTTGDVVAIFNYTTMDYTSMNRLLFGNLDNSFDHAAYAKKNEVTMQALKKLPNYEGGMTMRGDAGRYDWQTDFFIGNTFATKGFWSTGIKMCFDFVPLQITVFGKTGKQVAAMSEKPRETEVLFAPGTRFRVTSMYSPDLDKPGYKPDPDQKKEREIRSQLNWFITVEEVA
jgi:hypothetical protein